MNSNNYIVKLKHSTLIEEDYEKNEKNLIRIEVFDKNGNVINNEISYVQIRFSKDGALGFGKELIRAVFNKPFDMEYHNHLIPAKEGKPIQNMGVVLTHESPEFIVALQELGKINEEIKRSKE